MLSQEYGSSQATKGLPYAQPFAQSMFPLGQNIQPEDRCILIAIGQFGRQVLWEQDGLLSSFAIRVLVVRRTPKPMRQIADIVLHYDRHHAEIWPELRCLIDRAGSVGLVAAAGEWLAAC